MEILICQQFDKVKSMRRQWSHRHGVITARVHLVNDDMPMKLSIPELECCYVHALAAYGDVTLYVGKLT
jgi:hypothetical protein